MPFLKSWAETQPDKVAVTIAETGERLTFAELDRRADRVAAWLVGLGLEAGDTIALLLENDLVTFEIWWGARRAGLYFTPLNTFLTPAEASYLLRDSGAKLLVTGQSLADLAHRVKDATDSSGLRYVMAGGTAPGFSSLEDELAAVPADVSLPVRPVGREFMYSSGTTGMPKGIRRPLQRYEDRLKLPNLEIKLREIFGFDRDTIYLNTSPLYYAVARFNVRAIECGGSAVILHRFDAEAALRAIDRYKASCSHWVPTMFTRMLALPDDVRDRYDVSSMRCAIHAGAPCPQAVKERMIAWWGPVIDEYYGGSENAGVTHITSPEWLERRGSVGRSITGKIHIVDENGNELPAGEIGAIYFSGGVPFFYHNAPEKTSSAINEKGWGTYGDLGHVDADGYLFLSDRRADLILVGGINVYPKEIEDVLITHPKVADACVIGVPHEEYGEEVRAFVELRDAGEAGAELASTLSDYCRERLARHKWPRKLEFTTSLPRTETGKLQRRVLKEQYRAT